MVLSYFQRTRPDCKIESFYTTGRQKKNWSLQCWCVLSSCKTVFEAMVCFYSFCPCQEHRPSLTEENNKRGGRKRELDELRRCYLQEKSFTVIEMLTCDWRRLYKTITNVKLNIQENFPYRRQLTEHQLPEGIKKGNLFGYVQGDIEVPERLKANFANFPLIFKKTLVSKNDFGDWVKMYAEEEGITSQPRKMLMLSFRIKNGSLITRLLLFQLQLGLIVSKKRRFFNTLQRNVSTALYRQQWTQEGDLTKISIQVSLRRRWSC